MEEGRTSTSNVTYINIKEDITTLVWTSWIETQNKWKYHHKQHHEQKHGHKKKHVGKRNMKKITNISMEGEREQHHEQWCEQTRK